VLEQIGYHVRADKMGSGVANEMGANGAQAKPGGGIGILSDSGLASMHNASDHQTFRPHAGLPVPNVQARKRYTGLIQTTTVSNWFPFRKSAYVDHKNCGPGCP